MTATRLMAYADKGQLWFDEPGRFAGLMAKLKGERLRVTIEKPPSLRTLAQNALLWATHTTAALQVKEKLYEEGIAAMEEYTGHSKEELHEIMKARYCPEKEIAVPGWEPVLVKSTRLLSSQEMSEFYERCVADYAQHGIEVA